MALLQHRKSGIVNIKNHFHTRVNSKTCTGIIIRAKHLKNGFNWYVYVGCCWFVHTYFESMLVILKSMLWIEVKMFVAPWTTHSLVSGIAIGVHHDKNTGSFREQRGNTPENLPSIKTTCKKRTLIHHKTLNFALANTQFSDFHFCKLSSKAI